jgi:hypothetical protein
MSGAISLIALIESEFEAELESESPHMLIKMNMRSLYPSAPVWCQKGGVLIRWVLMDPCSQWRRLSISVMIEMKGMRSIQAAKAGL